MFPPATISNLTSISEEASISSQSRGLHEFNPLSSLFAPSSPHQHDHDQNKPKRKRSKPGNPDPEAEVIALSPKTLLATNRFVCEICNKGFQRDQNLQLHRRGHNLPWRLRQRNEKEAIRKKVYVCPEPSCIHHHPSRALGDLTGIKKHFCRKHGEKKWKCDKCSKKYAVQADWKAHMKTCGTREYTCDCGTLFSRKDSFITHRAFCDALAEESLRIISTSDHSKTPNTSTAPLLHQSDFFFFSTSSDPSSNPNSNSLQPLFQSSVPAVTAPHLSATALLQRASAMGHLPPAAALARGPGSSAEFKGATGELSTCWKSNQLTRDFLGVVSSDVAGERLLPLPAVGLDRVTSFPCSRSGDHTNPLAGLGFPPITEAWNDC